MLSPDLYDFLRSRNTLQQALEVVQRQRPFQTQSKDPDSISQATTIPFPGGMG